MVKSISCHQNNIIQIEQILDLQTSTIVKCKHQNIIWNTQTYVQKKGQSIDHKEKKK
jgi:hypothetical protein